MQLPAGAHSPPPRLIIRPEHLSELRGQALHLKNHAGAVGSTVYSGVITEAALERTKASLLDIARTALAMHEAVCAAEVLHG